MKRVPSQSGRCTLVSAVALVGAGLVASGCTSFEFRSSSRGSAPSDMLDRSSMIIVKGGAFEMGAANAEPDEYPPHRVEVGTFVIDRTEVTIKDYTRCVRARVCRVPEVPDVGPNVTPEHPVVGVSWFDAQKYCGWVGKRLPTEAEWEFAARTPHFGAFPWGRTFVAGKANLRGEEDGYARTAPVGSFPEGRASLGIVDMAGNAAEWTADWYDSTYYQKSPAQRPTGPEAPTGSKSVRGGAWSDNDYLARAGARLGLEPNRASDGVGFRCAADR